MFVLSYRAGSLVAMAARIGVAFLFGGFGQRVVPRRVETWRWLFILTGILGVAAGIMTLASPDITLHVVSILVAWYLIVSGIVHLLSALAHPHGAVVVNQLPLGIAELVRGVWAVRSWERSLTDVGDPGGVWAIVNGTSGIFAAFSLRQAGEPVERILDRHRRTPALRDGEPNST